MVGTGKGAENGVLIRSAEAFERLIDSTHAKYIMLSYNNMAEKGNDR